MIKKKFLNNEGAFKYNLNRACKHCKAPIPDGEHAIREFCPKTIDSEGNIRDCKTAYHRNNDKDDRNFYANHIANQKAISSRIEFLIKQKGYEVLTSDLDIYEINLTESIEFHLQDDGVLKSRFFKHSITSNPFNNIHKISYND